MIEIRTERPGEQRDVHDVTVEAFGQSGFGHHGEAPLIQQLRENDPGCWSLVALMDGRLVGHALFSSVAIQYDNGEVSGMGLGPMAVSVRHQGTGIGSALIKFGINQLFNDGVPFIVVLGHPGYYPKFGFEAASKLGWFHGFQGIPQEVFFGIVNDRVKFPFAGRGRVFYRPEFGNQHTHGDSR